MTKWIGKLVEIFKICMSHRLVERWWLFVLMTFNTNFVQYILKIDNQTQEVHRILLYFHVCLFVIFFPPITSEKYSNMI